MDVFDHNFPSLFCASYSWRDFSIAGHSFPIHMNRASTGTSNPWSRLVNVYSTRGGTAGYYFLLQAADAAWPRCSRGRTHKPGHENQEIFRSRSYPQSSLQLHAPGHISCKTSNSSTFTSALASLIEFEYLSTLTIYSIVDPEIGIFQDRLNTKST